MLARACLTVEYIAYGDSSNSVRLINKDGHKFCLSLRSKTIFFPASLAGLEDICGAHLYAVFCVACVHLWEYPSLWCPSGNKYLLLVHYFLSVFCFSVSNPFNAKSSIAPVRNQSHLV